MKRPLNAMQKGIRKVSVTLLVFMLVRIFYPVEHFELGAKIAGIGDGTPCVHHPRCREPRLEISAFIRDCGCSRDHTGDASNDCRMSTVIIHQIIP